VRAMVRRSAAASPLNELSGKGAENNLKSFLRERADDLTPTGSICPSPWATITVVFSRDVTRLIPYA